MAQDLRIAVIGQAAFGAAAFYGIGVPTDTVEGYVWTKLAAEQGVPKAVSNLSEMSGALTEDEREQADKRVARFEPKENEAGGPDFANNRGKKRPRAASSLHNRRRFRNSAGAGY